MPRKASVPKSSSLPQRGKHPAKQTACLCLLCRQVGHVIKSCPYLSQGKRRSEFSGLTLPAELEATRLSAAFDSSSSPTTAAPKARSLCQRCKNLNIFNSFTNAFPFTLDDKEPYHANMDRATRKINQIRALDPAMTLRLLSTCSLCCLIFDITYLTEDDLRDITDVIYGPRCQVVLVLAWTINRLERDVRWPGYAEGEGPYAKCMYTSVLNSPAEAYARIGLADWAMDAVGVEEIHEGGGEGTRALGLKKVDSATPDYGMIGGWLRRCDDLHRTTCRPTWSEDLRKIKLVDVEDRKIVGYPPSACDYITLSYVWGGVEQRSYKLGEALPAASLPATIEDAMTVTQKLGKRYLWVDSLCIDQGNITEKLAQIGLMSVIYNGAWATVICVSGQSTHSGLPRVGTSDGVIPQLLCEVDGKRLLSVMPTLPRQLSQSPWTKRAWTYQEGLLSPRRIFFTNHQVYFECNSTQCCESLDHSNSPFHSQSDEQRHASLAENLPAYQKNSLDNGIERMFGQGVFRDPFRSFPVPGSKEDEDDIFMKYLKLVYTYTSKKMTQDSDSVHAISAVLTRLNETHYKGGFVQGLPVQEFPRALLWTHANLPRRRLAFPAWSWAGWEGAVKPIYIKGTCLLQKENLPPLRAWKAGTHGQPELIYDFDPTRWIPEDDSEPGSDEKLDVGRDGDGRSEASASDESADSDIVGEGGATKANSSTESLDPHHSWLHDLSSDEESEEMDNRKVTPWIPKKVARNRDPLFLIAKAMLDEPSSLPEKIDPAVLLLDGITIRFKFKKTRNQQGVDSDTEGGPHDVEENLKAKYERCLVEFQGTSSKQELRFYGSNAKKVINKRNGKDQDFIIVARESELLIGGDIWYALLLVDWDGDVASRVAVASLGLDDVGLLANVNAQRRLIRLK